MKNIVKRFPGVRALDNVNLEVEEGEIHALVGENGAENHPDECFVRDLSLWKL